MRRRKRERGFTFVEMLLTVVLVGILATVAAKLLLVGLDIYALIVNRNNAFHNARVAVDRMTDEMLLVETDDITWIGDQRFSFIDAGGSGTNFRQTTVSQGGLSVPCLYREDDYLAGNVTSLDFDYYREDGSMAFFIWQVRRINIDLTVEAPGNAGAVRLRTEVFPRNFMYTNFR